MNPDAEETERLRHGRIINGLRAELRDHTLSKTEALDEEHSDLEYIRERNQLRMLEAKSLLSGILTIAGDYDCILGGVYGETNLSTESTSHEMIPLLKQLLAMLENGVPFVMTPQLMNRLQGGDSDIYQGDLMVGSAGMPQGQKTGQQMKLAKAQPQVESQHVIETTLVQRAPMGDTVAMNPLDSSVIIDPSKLKHDNLEHVRALITKQTYEAAKLENDLKSNEIHSMNDIINDYEQRKQGMINDVAKDMHKRQAKATTDEEKEAVMMEYANNVQKLTEALEKQKQQQLAALQKTLLEKRRKDKKDLHRAHIAEAKAEGMDVSLVPSITVPMHDQMEKDLRMQLQEQEAALAEMRRVATEQNSQQVETSEDDIRKQVAALEISDSEKEALIKLALSQDAEAKKRETKLRNKMESRQERNQTRKSYGVDALSDEEKNGVVSTQETARQADRTREENLLLAALRAQDQVEFNA